MFLNPGYITERVSVEAAQAEITQSDIINNGLCGGYPVCTHRGAGEPGVPVGRGEGVQPGHGRGDAGLGRY